MSRSHGFFICQMGSVKATLRILGVFLKTDPCRAWPLVLASQLNEKQTAPLVETLETCMT